ncbi:hypothetical protein Leryth_025336 [Lithospermum erythrorhizon]|nr:hypothetical protein Leryth_025336 [Lithospermum erythrorhizon]
MKQPISPRGHSIERTIHYHAHRVCETRARECSMPVVLQLHLHILVSEISLEPTYLPPKSARQLEGH